MVGANGSRGKLPSLGVPSRGRRDGSAVRGRFARGDTLKITRLDRLGRSVPHLVTLGAELRDRGVGAPRHRAGIDTTTAEGRAMFGMLSSLAELVCGGASKRDLKATRHL